MEINTQLVKQSSLTDSDFEEKYILTKEEEEKRIEFEIKELKNFRAWKLAQAGFSDQEILKRISLIDWEKEINREEILKQANSNKQQSIWHAQSLARHNEMEKKRISELKDQWNAKNIFRLMQWSSQDKFSKKLIVNKYNKHFITALCYFISEDERFEKELNFSFKKGLLIRGISGIGKTHLVKCLEENELNPILILSMIDITEEIKDQGEYRIDIGKNKIIYLDDVGTEEPVVNHFGTKIPFFKNFIELVYLKNKTFGKLMISTNNSFAELEEKYGFRVRSRMEEMFNVIDVKGEDMRLRKSNEKL